MKHRLISIRMESRRAPFMLLFCSIPYLAMRLYLWRDMHAADPFVSAPEPWVSATIAVVGGLVPAVGLWIIMTKLIRDRDRFRLPMLAMAYASLILIFASDYAILQASSVEPSFFTMPLLWQEAEGASLADHVRRLHEIFINSLYLSVTTITTVGFGDVAPLSPSARVLAGIGGNRRDRLCRNRLGPLLLSVYPPAMRGATMHAAIRSMTIGDPRVGLGRLR